MSIALWFRNNYHHYRRARAERFDDGIIPRLEAGQIKFFTPWGPRYDYQIRGEEVLQEHAEERLLEFLAAWLKSWPEEHAANISWIFLAADSYGTEVNKLPSTVVENYFRSIRTRVDFHFGSKAQFVYWSQLREVAMPYRKTAELRHLPLLNPEILKRAERIAARRGGDAKQYLIERMAEALYMEAIHKPIKVSCASRQDDGGIDLNLPRLYIVPNILHRPWDSKQSVVF